MESIGLLGSETPETGDPDRSRQVPGATFACGRDAVWTIDTLPKKIFPTGSLTDNNRVDKPRYVEVVYKSGHWGRAPMARFFRIDHRGRAVARH
jgi:hypothetical protein